MDLFWQGVSNSVKQLLVSEGQKLTINDLRLHFVAELLRKANMLSFLSSFDSLCNFGNTYPFTNGRKPSRKKIFFLSMYNQKAVRLLPNFVQSAYRFEDMT